MTTRKELLDVGKAVADINSITLSINGANDTAKSNQVKLSSLLQALDENYIETVRIQIYLKENREVIHVDFNHKHKKDQLTTDKIISMTVEELAKRVADAMNRVRELAAKLKD